MKLGHLQRLKVFAITGSFPRLPALWARKKGFYRLELGVLSTNEQAISLYKKFGFQEEGIRKSRYHIDGTWVDEILMSKLL